MNFFKTKTKEKEQPVRTIAIFDPNVDGSNKEPRTITVAGDIYFEIHMNGNGKFVAKHRKGKYLYSFDGDYKHDRDLHFYENATFFSSYEKCKEACFDYIRHFETKVVGLVYSSNK